MKKLKKPILVDKLTVWKRGDLIKILENVENKIAKNILTALIQFVGIMSIVLVGFAIVSKLGLNTF